MLIASLELGGTKTIAAIGRDPSVPLAQARFVTRGGDETLCEVEAFFRAAIAEHGRPDALGIATFGPVGLNRGSADWGFITRHSKPGWSGTDVAGRLGASLGCDVALDTDVNAAAFAESRLGAGRGADPLVYLTVGTGIGGGLIVGGEIVHGSMHPEMGHLMLRRHPDDDFVGCCSYHGDCIEGLASGRSIIARFGMTASQLPAGHPFRAVLANYLGQLCAGVVLIASPRRIVIGGGVIGTGDRRQDTLESVATAMRRQLGGYVSAPALDASDYLAAPYFEDAGLVGAYLLGLNTAMTRAGILPA